MKYITILFILLTSSCRSNYDNFVTSEGHTKSELINLMGIPTKIENDSLGNDIFVYEKNRKVKILVYENDQISEPKVLRKRIATYYFNKEGLIYSWDVKFKDFD